MAAPIPPDRPQEADDSTPRRAPVRRPRRAEAEEPTLPRAPREGRKTRPVHPVRVGQQWRDTDPRSPGPVRVLEVSGKLAQIQRTTGTRWIKTERLQKTFRLVEDVAA